MIEGAASGFLFLAVVTVAAVLFGPFRARAYEARVRGLRQPSVAPDAPAAALRGGRVRPGLGDGTWSELTASRLQQANIHLRVGEYVVLRVICGFVAFALTLLIWRAPVAVPVALLAGFGGYLLPRFYIGWLRARRIAQVERQLIEFLPSLASSLRAGFAFQQGVDVAVKHIGPPLADELALFQNDVNLGATMDAALRALARRVGSAELEMVITAILVQRMAGGSLAELLEQAAETLRERDRIFGDIRALTAQQRLTGFVLSVYPIGVGLVLLALMPSLWSKLFTEPVGQVQLAVALVLQVVGFIAIRRAVRVDV